MEIHNSHLRYKEIIPLPSLWIHCLTQNSCVVLVTRWAVEVCFLLWNLWSVIFYARITESFMIHIERKLAFEMRVNEKLPWSNYMFHDHWFHPCKDIAHNWLDPRLPKVVHPERKHCYNGRCRMRHKNN